MINKDFFQLLGPFFLITWVIFITSTGLKIKINNNYWATGIIFILSAIVSFAPLFDLSLAEYLLSINPNFSIGSLTLIILLLTPYVLNRTILTENNLFFFCLWNVLLSLILFLSCLGLLPFDLYAWGYAFSPWFVVMAAVTLTLVWAAPPLAMIFLVYIFAFDLKLLASGNFFDYLSDGFLFLLSAAVLAGRAVRYRRAEARGAGHQA
ncbi:MAG: hypothetical protein ACUVXF_00165 [Desulfobaccales bacterium]